MQKSLFSFHERQLEELTSHSGTNPSPFLAHFTSLAEGQCIGE